MHGSNFHLVSTLLKLSTHLSIFTGSCCEDGHYDEYASAAVFKAGPEVSADLFSVSIFVNKTGFEVCLNLCNTRM
jgi:hypothetical protein